MMNTYFLRRTARQRSFTLVELMVAIGIVSFLILGIGQVFRSVGNLVSLGTAVAEVDQMARSIERQLRDDFAALSAMRTEDTFIAIRMRELGDANHNSTLDANSNETAVYLTQKDRELDQLDIVAGVITGPYAQGSRAVTIRLDEIAFLAQPIVGGNYTSFEPDRNGVMEASADTALIYYGHALRPAPDPNWPPDATAPDPPRIPQRMNVPDGDFGQRAGDDNRYFDTLGSLYNQATSLQLATGRNEYATGWILARQALLLAGGEAAGVADSRYGITSIAGPGNAREYAPYIRDLETINRFWGVGGGLGPYSIGLDHQGPRSGLYDPSDPSNIFPPAPRIIQHGRVDICAQNRADVQRWLQGEPPLAQPGATPPAVANQVKSPPFREGRFSVAALGDEYLSGEFVGAPFDDPLRSVRGMLWQQQATTAPDDQRYFDTRRGIRAAIAGVFTRVLADSEPPFIDRDRDTTNISYPILNSSRPTDAEDALMDAHAMLAERCSNFEIAWRMTDPDWPVARQDIDIDGDTVPEFRSGDRIWIDITTLNPNNPNLTRSTVQNWVQENIGSFDIGDPPSFGATPLSGTEFADANQQPELGYEDWRNPSGTTFDFDFAQAVDKTGTQITSTNPLFPLYNPEISSGAPELQREYLAIWPFHAPRITGGGYEEVGFPKKLQIRIRMTLHDSQRRISGGKTFEYIFDVSPGD